jgi:hypothetical protein
MATNLQHIKTLDVNTSPTSLGVYVGITECFNENFDSYFVNVTKVDGNLGGYYLSMRYLDINGAEIATSSYAYANLYMTSHQAYTEFRSQSSTVAGNIGFSGSGGLDVDQYDNGTSMYIHNPHNTDRYTFHQAQASGISSTPYHAGFKSIGVYKSTDRVYGFSIRGHSAFYGMKIAVYGVK